MKKGYGPLTIVLVLIAFVTACRQASRAPATSPWDQFVHAYVEGYLAANPTFAANAGRHEYDGRLPDWSSAALARDASWLRDWRSRAQAFDSASLEDVQRFEREHLISQIDGDLFWLESAEAPYRNPLFYAGPLDPSFYISRDYAPLADRMRAYIGYLKAVPAAVEQVRANLRTPLPKTYVDFGSDTFGGLATFYERDAPAAFRTVADSGLQSDFRSANEKAIQAVRALEAWMDGQRAGASDAFALGPELFRQMLHDTEGLEFTLEKLEEIGREDLDRNRSVLNAVCSEFAPRKSISECISMVRNTKSKGGPLDVARRHLPALKSFLAGKNVVGIPGDDDVLVAEAPPYMRWSLAFIQVPGAFEKLPSIYYISPPDESLPPAAQDAAIPGDANLLITTAHEVWPGHQLEYQHTRRSTSPLGRLFRTGAFSEGWAHYAEEMVVESGLAEGKPEVRIAQLAAALMRDARYLSAIGLHTNNMSLEEAERIFGDQAFAHGGRAQAARGTFDPSYLNYTLGKLMIRKLRDDWTRSRGDRGAWRSFHDEFLSHGGAPIPLIRKAMLGADAGPPL